MSNRDILNGLHNYQRQGAESRNLNNQNYSGSLEKDMKGQTIVLKPHQVIKNKANSSIQVYDQRTGDNAQANNESALNLSFKETYSHQLDQTQSKGELGNQRNDLRMSSLANAQDKVTTESPHLLIKQKQQTDYFSSISQKKRNSGTHKISKEVLLRVNDLDQQIQIQSEKQVKQEQSVLSCGGEAKTNNPVQILNKEQINQQILKLKRHQVEIKRNALKSAGIGYQDNILSSHFIQNLNQADKNNQLKLKIQQQHLKQGSLEAITSSIGQQVSTKSSINDYSSQEVHLKSQLKQQRVPQQKAVDIYKEIYTKEFVLDKGTKPEQLKMPAQQKIHSYIQQQNGIEISPTNNAQMRNTFHGSVGFFDQRNIKINNQNHITNYNALDKFNPIKQPSQQYDKKSQLKQSIEKQANQIQSYQTSFISPNQNALPALSKTGINFNKGLSNYGTTSPNLRADQQSTKHQQAIYQSTQQYQNDLQNAYSSQGNPSSYKKHKQIDSKSNSLGTSQLSGYQTYNGFYAQKQEPIVQARNIQKQADEFETFRPRQQKHQIKFEITTANDVQPNQYDNLQKEHQENLNLLFYDFNNGAKQNKISNQDQISDSLEATNGQFYNMLMSNTGSNFFQRFGDRLPTRETKSRRGRFQQITTAQANRGKSLVDNINNQQLIPQNDTPQAEGKQGGTGKKEVTKSLSKEKLKDSKTKYFKVRKSSNLQNNGHWYKFNNKEIGEQDEDEEEQIEELDLHMSSATHKNQQIKIRNNDQMFDISEEEININNQ